MNRPESWENPSESFEQFPPERLITYLQGQYEDAFRKEQAENRRGELANHGSFVQHVPVELEHTLTRGADRIVLKPPHPHDEPGTYCEVYALLVREEDSFEHSDAPGAFATQFVVRMHTQGVEGPWLLADEAGVHDLEFDDAQELDSLEADPLSRLTKAEALLEMISRFNIVAVRE